MTGAVHWDCFLAYASADRDVAEELYEMLAPNARVFLDCRCLRPGDDWAREIAAAQRGSSVTVVLVSTRSGDAYYQREEIQAAIEMERSSPSSHRLIPIFFGSVSEVPYGVRTKHGIRVDDRINLPEAASTLLRLLRDTDALLLPSAPPLTIAIMGAKGGVGKTTIVSCIAQMIAEQGHEVAIIDFDVLDEGATNEAKRYLPVRSFAVKSVYDHLAPHSKFGAAHLGHKDENLCDITPRHLRERHLGRVWLLPARNKQKNKHPFQVFTTMDSPQESVVRNITREILDRVRTQLPHARMVIIDCGAGRNTLFAAAFAEADVGYIVTLPNRAYFANVSEQRDEIVDVYPDIRLEKVFTVVNRVTCQAEVEMCDQLDPEPIAFVPFDPTVERDNNLLGSVEYGMGYNEVFSSLQKCLAESFKELPNQQHRALVPDEFKARYKPWFRMLVDEQLADKKLKSPRFQALVFASWLAPALLAVLLAILASRYSSHSYKVAEVRSSSEVAMPAAHPVIGDIVGIVVVGVSLLIAVWWLVAVQEPRRRILRRAASVSPQEEDQQRQFFRNLLNCPSDRSVLGRLTGDRRCSHLRWLKHLVEDRLAEEKKRRLQSTAE